MERRARATSSITATARQTQPGEPAAANGHPAPYKVKYWQLGNELSGDDDAYIKKCQEFIAAMKKVDPGIAILSSFPSPKVFEVLGKDLTYVCASPLHARPRLLRGRFSEALEADRNNARLRTPSARSD